MGTISVEIATGANTYTGSRTVSGAHLIRFRDAYMGLYGQVEDPPESGTFRDMTEQEIMDKLFDGFFLGLKNNVLRQEQIEAAQTAKDGVTEIDMS